MSEVKWWVTTQRMISAEEAMVFVAAVTEAVRRHVADRAALTAIADELARLTGRADLAPPEGGDAPGGPGEPG
jgi:hypothetical protein